MKIDDAIKLAYDKEASELNASSSRYEEMLNYIEEQGHIEGARTNGKIFIKIGNIINKIHIKDFLEVACFLFVLIFIPSIVVHYKNDNLTNKTKQNITMIDKKVNSAFADKIGKIVENKHSDDTNISTSQSDKQEFSDLDSIKSKTPFTIAIPQFIPEGYKLKSTQLTIETRQLEENKNSQIHEVTLQYGNDKQSINIFQVEDSGKPYMQTTTWEKISINGVDAWIDSNLCGKNDYIQIMMWSYGVYYNISGTVGQDNLIKIAQSLGIKSDAEDPGRKTIEYYENINTMKDIIPFTIEYPKYIPDGYTFTNAFLTVIKNKDGAYYELNIDYSNSDNKSISIMEINEKNKIDDITSKCEKVSTDGTEIWAYPAKDKDSENQVMFWRKDKFLDISSKSMDKENLIKMAQSFQDSYTRVIPSNALNIKAEGILDYKAMSQKGCTVMVAKELNDSWKDNQVYNINKLESFMTNIKAGKKDNIRVIKYCYNENKTWVDMVMDMEYDGKDVKVRTYDLYSDKNYYLPNEVGTFKRIIKLTSGSDIRYTLSKLTDKYSEDLNILNLDKDAIKN